MISDNDLLLYHYGDGLDARERNRIEAAVRAEPELAARLRMLVTQLDAASASADVPVPADVEQRWQAALERAVLDDAATQTTPRFRRTLARAASVAAVTMVGVVAWIAWKPASDEPPVQMTHVPTVAAGEQSLRWHLANAEEQLASLGTASDAQRAALIAVVIAQNGLYAAAADKAGDQRLARALRSFTPILEDLAANKSAGDLAQLNFELRVMQARLAPESPSGTPPLPVNL